MAGKPRYGAVALTGAERQRRLTEAKVEEVRRMYEALLAISETRSAAEARALALAAMPRSLEYVTA